MKALLTASALTSLMAAPSIAAELEVTHWWTSGGEAAAVAEFANAFNDGTEHSWVDGAIAGSGSTARPIIVSRILGGEPMGATQFNHGRQAEELIEAGLMLDLTDLAEAEGWRDFVNPSALLDACTLNGRIYCVPVNIHGWEWMWLSHKAYADAGLEVPQSYEAFVESAPSLRAAGKVPLAFGQQSWQADGVFGVLLIATQGLDIWREVLINNNSDVIRGPEVAAVFEEFGRLRELAKGSNVNEWNQATNLVITGQAGAQIMGDWAQGEFAVAGQVAGEDYTCLPGLGAKDQVLSAGGDAFYFPINDAPEITAAQKALASTLISKDAQVAFNLQKGSLPVRGDIDMSAANDCMQKGLAILAAGNILPTGDMTRTPDTVEQLRDLLVEYWSDPSFAASDAQEEYARIIERAD